MGTRLGEVYEFDPSGSRRIATGGLLKGNGIAGLTEDSGDNVWLATSSNGATKIFSHGFAAYSEADGFGALPVGVLEDRAGQIVVTHGRWQFSTFKGKRFVSGKLRLPDDSAGWPSSDSLLQDHNGEWWAGTREGLYRFPKAESALNLGTLAPKAVYTQANGLADRDVYRLFEDWRGDLWISGFAPARAVVTRWDRLTARFHQYSDAQGLPSFNSPSAIVEDAKHNVWIGFREGGLARHRDGKFRLFGPADGFPAGEVKAVYFDRTGRLWCSVGRLGLFRFDDTSGQRLTPRSYSVQQGPGVNLVFRINEDKDGRIYAGTPRGVDRIDPLTGKVDHYTAADGFAGGDVMAILRDRSGALWFSTLNGLLRYLPGGERVVHPSPVLIGGLRIAGVDYQISAIGARDLVLPELPYQRNSLQIDFLRVAFTPGEIPHFEYGLEGADSQWSPPTPVPTVNYAGLPPGRYRFLVRNPGADPRESPATISFRILSPFWRRWWFLSAVGTIVVSSLIAFARYRESRVQELGLALEESRGLAKELTLQRSALHRANATLGMEFAVARILAEAATPAEAEAGILQILCANPGWAAGAFWSTQGSGRELHCTSFWRSPDSAGPTCHIKVGSRCVPGQSLAGKAALDNVPCWSAVSATDADVRDTLDGIVAYPIAGSREVIGVMEFFDSLRRRPSEDQVAAVAAVCGLIGQWAERNRAEEALRETETALRRSREERLQELERVRRRIATDLHDDVGSSLTQISLLSELARREAGVSSPVKRPLSLIADSARELIDVMSDIVWSINPQRDHLSDLLQRMRRFAADTLTSRDIRFSLDLPAAGQEIRMEGSLRREVFLIFKEAIHNAVRHSECTHANIRMHLDDGRLFLTVRDNGIGMDLARDNDGHGLSSMRARSVEIGAEFQVLSQPGTGTSIILTVPLFRNPAITSVGYTNT